MSLFEIRCGAIRPAFELLPVGRSSNGTALYECVCPDCGTVRHQDKRKIGKPCHPCAMKRRATHGMSGSRLHRVYTSMVGRCTYPSSSHYRYYGGRGIDVCSSWRADPQEFFDWAKANGYADDLELDRIDPDGNYEPGNCRFITHMENSQRRRNSRCTLAKAREIKALLADGLTYTEAALKAGTPRMVAWHIHKGNTWRNA